MSSLSVLIITKNSAGIIHNTLKSVKDLADEIVVIDDNSIDNTRQIVERYNAKYYLHHEEDLGKQRMYGLKKCTSNWILVLDSDEVITTELEKEIHTALLNAHYDAYLIPYQNHFLGKKITYGGEDYKMLRLFKSSVISIKPNLVHEKIETKSKKVGTLQNKLYHYSYRSIPQVYRKFTMYALKIAKQKIEKGESTNMKKVFLYPTHMFWARFIQEKGYKDGFFRIFLDFGFAYMEFVTYVSMLFIKKEVHHE